MAGFIFGVQCLNPLDQTHIVPVPELAEFLVLVGCVLNSHTLSGELAVLLDLS